MTRNPSMAAELVWEHAPHDTPESGLSRARAAAPDELERVARALDLVACSSLRVSYTIAPSVARRYRLSGTLSAEVTQTCVVTLDPVTSVIEEPFDVMFWPAEDIPAAQSGEVDMDEEPEPEPMIGGQVNVGRVVFECLAAAIDPFPRQSDATLDRRSAEPAEGATGASTNPFAVLANIKTRD
jgi:uncharacterized metal-binding protein YceD (DUF177 family)